MPTKGKNRAYVKEIKYQKKMEEIKFTDFKRKCSTESGHKNGLTLSKVTPHRGLKPFTYETFEYGTELIWAINKKNADRKARKLGFIH